MAQIEAMIELFRANPAPALVVLFLGVFYWAFRGRGKRGGPSDS